MCPHPLQAHLFPPVAPTYGCEGLAPIKNPSASRPARLRNLVVLFGNNAIFQVFGAEGVLPFFKVDWIKKNPANAIAPIVR